jgi:hypothetical protein
MSIKLTSSGGGFDKLQREMKDFQRAMESLNGTVANLKFTSDPESVEAAIRQMEQAIDEKVALYGNNKMVTKVAQGMKERYRNHIRDVAKGEG